MPGFSRTLSRVEARANGTYGRVGASQRRNCAEGFRANNPNRLTRADVSSWHITIFDCAAKIGRNRANGDRARAAVGPSWPRSCRSPDCTWQGRGRDLRFGVSSELPRHAWAAVEPSPLSACPYFKALVCGLSGWGVLMILHGQTPRLQRPKSMILSLRHWK